MRSIPLLVAGLATAILTTSALADQCVTLFNNPISVDGVIGGGAIGSAPSPTGSCLPDVQWAGRAAPEFESIGGAGLTSAVSRVMLAAYGSTFGTIDTFYVGIHNENDPGFNADDNVTLYFDTGTIGTFDSQDFAISVELGPITEPIGREECNKRPTHVDLFTYNPIQHRWEARPLPTTSEPIMVRTSYDYNIAADPENEIWEAEIAIDLQALGLAIDPAAGLRFGGKMHVNTPGYGTEYLTFPQGATSVLTPADPNLGGFVPAKIDGLTTGACAGDVVITAIDSTSPGGAVGSFKRFGPNTVWPLSPEQTNHLTAKVRFTNTDLVGDTSTILYPNTGSIELELQPYNAGFLGKVSLPVRHITFESFREELVDIPWPITQADYLQYQSMFNQADHVCYFARLQGFQFNMNAPDKKQKNLHFVTASEIPPDYFAVQPFGEEGGERVYYMRAHWANVPTEWIGEPSIKPKPYLWSYAFMDPDTIGSQGLTDIGNGWYRFVLYGKRQDIGVKINAGVMPTQVENYELSAQAGGSLFGDGSEPLEIPVKPNSAVTIIANGEINLFHSHYEKLANGPNGFRDADPNQSAQYLLSSVGYTPSQQVGALIASFDNFATSFSIGATSTFVVPVWAKGLWVAVNDRVNEYGNNKGSFLLSVSKTDATTYPTRLRLPGSPKNGIPDNVEAGVNLPQLLVDVYQVDEDAGWAQAAGSATWVIYESHQH
jgi:hypothetical protein